MNGLSYKEVAYKYNVDVTTVYRWVRKGLLKPSKFVGRVYFTDSAIAAFEKLARQ